MIESGKQWPQVLPMKRPTGPWGERYTAGFRDKTKCTIAAKRWFAQEGCSPPILGVDFHVIRQSNDLFAWYPAGMTPPKPMAARAISNRPAAPIKSSVEEIAKMLADPPRVRTRDDIHRIREMLDTEYDTSRECYFSGGSDRYVAERLKVPQRWVSDERSIAYGDLDRNEADLKAEAAAAEAVDIGKLIARANAAIAELQGVTAQLASLKSLGDGDR